KNIVGLCVGIWSFATVLAGMARTFLQLFLVRSVLGIGEAGYAPASLSLLGDYFPKGHRGRILSYWSMGTLIGAAIGFTLGVLVAALVFSFFTIGGTSFWLPSYIVDDFHLKVGTAGILTGAVLVTSGLVGTVVGGWLADTFQRRWPEGRLLVATSGLLIGAPLVLLALFIHTLWLFVVVFIL